MTKLFKTIRDILVNARIVLVSFLVTVYLLFKNPFFLFVAIMGASLFGFLFVSLSGVANSTGNATEAISIERIGVLGLCVGFGIVFGIIWLLTGVEIADSYTLEGQSPQFNYWRKVMEVKFRESS